MRKPMRVRLTKHTLARAPILAGIEYTSLALQPFSQNPVMAFPFDLPCNHARKLQLRSLNASMSFISPPIMPRAQCSFYTHRAHYMQAKDPNSRCGDPWMETGKFELIMNTLTLSIPADYAASSYEVTLTFSK
jgi:hypothetical protein